MTKKLGPWDCTNEEYHADKECVSHSALEIFRKSPKLYKLWRDGKWQRERTPEMRLGSALHILVLQPEKSNDLLQVSKVTSRNSKTYKEEEKESDKLILLPNEYDRVQKMKSSLLDSPKAKRLIEGGLNEQAYRFIDPVTSIKCKVKIDCQNTTPFFSGIIDIKSSRDPSKDSWVRDATNFGYHRQAAFYDHGLQISRLDPTHRNFAFIVVGSIEPYDCVIYEFNQESLAVGQSENDALFADLEYRNHTDNWNSRDFDQITTVSLPGWYKK